MTAYKYTDDYMVKYDENRLVCIPRYGIPVASELEDELNKMQEEVKNDFCKKPIHERYEWAYHDLCRRIMDMRRRNGEIAPPTREVQEFARGITERVFQQVQYEGEKL